jgi:aspartate carbamoyltransferase regulatory subunit
MSDPKSNEKELKIRPIKNGIVVDHIVAGQVLNVCKILKILPGSEKVVSIAMNVDSKRLGLGRKDILKIEGRKIEHVDEIAKIAIISPDATVNIIEDFLVKEKRQVEIPSEIIGIIKCPNPNCISNVPEEPVKTKFKKEKRGSEVFFSCLYCGYFIYHNEIASAII